MSVQCMLKMCINVYKCDEFLLLIKHLCIRLKGIYENHIAKIYEEVIRCLDVNNFMQIIYTLK